jgi:hypothetical protein
MVIKHVTKWLRKQWPKTRLVWRGDSHYDRVARGGKQRRGLWPRGQSVVAESALNLRFHHASLRA